MSHPSTSDLRTACVDAGLCAADAFEEAVRTQRQMASRGERMSLLDVLVIQGTLAPDHARTLRSRGLGSVGFTPESDPEPESPPAPQAPRGGVRSAARPSAAAPASDDPPRPTLRRNNLPPPAPSAQAPAGSPGSPARAGPAQNSYGYASPAPQPASRGQQAPPPASRGPQSQPVQTERAARAPASPTQRPTHASPSPTARPAHAAPDEDPPRPKITRTAPHFESRAPAPRAQAPAAASGTDPDATHAWSHREPTDGAIPRRAAPHAPAGATADFDADDLRAALTAPAGAKDRPGAVTARAPRVHERAATAAPSFSDPTLDAPDDADATLPPPPGGGEVVLSAVAARPFGADLAGRTLGGCRFDRELGRGAMGVVYEATHLSLQRRVAVKVLIPTARRSNRDVEQFFQEARALARIEHQNIVQVHDVGEQDGLYYIVMQYLEGETLAERLDRMRCFPWEEACRYARDVAHGLAVAHEKGIVHRDIKPENVFFTADGVVKIADFGLAAQAARPEEGSGRTEVMGTPAYMSPEQIDGRNVDGRADLYSLGCSMYVMLTGKKPFEGSTAIEVLLKQTKDVAVPVCRVVPSVPVSVSQVVEKLMAKAPQARYAKADALAADLEKILGGGKPKVVVEIEDVMGRMQDLMREAEAPRTGLAARPYSVIAAGTVVIASLATVLTMALPSVEIPAIDTEAVLAAPPEEQAAEAAAKAALAEAEALAVKLDDRIDLVLAQYDDVEKRWGHILLTPIRASRELTAERFAKRREARVAEARGKAAAVLRADPAAAVDILLALPDSMRQGPEIAGWAQDLEKALAALRTATGMTFVAGGRSFAGPLRLPAESKPFLIDVAEVTNADYAKFVEGTGARPPSHWGGTLPPAVLRDLPVVGLTAKEADEFAKWSGKRLPTSAEWERAARGADGYAYPWGEEFEPTRCIARHVESRGLVPVLSFAGGRSPEGVFHMAGNAAEWTADPATDPQLADCREVRGGSVRSHPAQCAAFVRYWMPEGTDDPALLIGFRCARDLR